MLNLNDREWNIFHKLKLMRLAVRNIRIEILSVIMYIIRKIHAWNFHEELVYLELC